MQKNDIAIWGFDPKRPAVLWANRAACSLWQQNAFTEDEQPSLEQLQQFSHALSISETFRFAFDNQQHWFKAELLADHCFLITEVAAPVLPYQQPEPTPLAAQRNLLSLYNQSGRLIDRSEEAERLLNEGETRFHERFLDPQEAEAIWQHLEITDYYEGACQMHSAQGVRWHVLNLSKRYISASDWQIQLREMDIDQFIRNEERLRSTLREQQVIFEHAGTGICFTKDLPDNYRQIVRCNHKFAEIYGYSTDELIGQSSAMLYASAEEYQYVGDAAYPRLGDGGLYSYRLKMKRKDGSLFWSEIRGKMISPQNPELGYIWIIEDINDYVQANQALKTVLNEHQLILDHAMVGIVFLKNRRVTHCNRRFEEIFGYDDGELHDSSSRQWYLSEHDWREAGRACYEPLSRGDVFKGEMLLSRKDGSPLWCEVSSKAIDPSDLDRGSIWITMDISERKAADAALARANEELEQRVESRTQELANAVQDLHQEINERRMAEERVKHMALHDALTGLPNRVLLEERLEQAVELAQRNSGQLAVLFIDLDRFKHINDSMGHHEGDQLLIQVANKLHDAVRSHDTVARLGGDEFVVVLNQVTSSEEVEQIIRQIQSSFQQEIRLALQDIYVTPSIGVAMYPNDGTSAIDLMKNADAAMYHAKDKGRNCSQFFNRGIDDSLKERVVLENALYQALKQQQFQLHYQPQVDVTSNRVIGAEALIRWRHPEKGLISPDAFIPLAEETGLIIDIGRWVLQEACQQLSRWCDQGMDDFVVSANLSALQVHQPEFVGDVQTIIDRSGVSPHLVDLELTESMIMRNAEETIAALKRLHNLGLQISVDDFGTGYSSLSYLKRFPLDKLKIDRSFVNDITADPDDAMICRTIISMAHNLNLKVIAEGVETHEQLSLLRNYGCELYQGYLFSRPVPADQISSMIAESFDYSI